MSIDNTLAERGSRYGEFINNASVAQDLKRVMAASSGWGAMDNDQRESLEVIAQKISRIVTGDPDYVDNWHDIQGYAKLVEDRLRGEGFGDGKA